MQTLLRFCRESIRFLEIVLLSFVLAWVLISIPFQHYMDLSRFQHYSFGMFAISIGFLMQALVSWRKLSRAGRLALLGSGVYLFAFGYVVWENPWIDRNVALETEFQERERSTFAYSFLGAGFVLALLWLRWSVERRRGMRSLVQAQQKVSD